jgi:hypothetical protein
LALPLAVAAPVGGVPGIKHVVWQDAACELHPIMQLATIEVWARRILAGHGMAQNDGQSAGQE